MTVSATFIIAPAPAAGTVIKIAGETSVQGVGGKIKLPEVQVNAPGGTVIIYPATSADRAFLDKIQYTDLEITWSLFIGAGADEKPGVSKNALYITWADPADGNPNHTALYIGCSKANGQDGTTGVDDHQVLDRIWNGFSGLQTAPEPIFSAYPRRLLTYWGFFDGAPANGKWDGGAPDTDCNGKSKATTPPESALELVQSGNGQCLAWADFLKKVLADQGLPSIDGKAVKTILITAKTGVQFFAIKNWETIGAGDVKGADPTPRWPIYGSPPDLTNNGFDAGVDGDPDSPYYSGRKKIAKAEMPEAYDAAGASGQGTSPNPPSRFTGHKILSINDVFFDPSYHIKATSIANYEMQGFAGRTNSELNEMMVEREYFRNTSVGQILCNYNPIGG